MKHIVKQQLNISESLPDLNNLPIPMLSCVIPCFNYSEYVVEAIESVKAQTLNNFECIIVDDGSTDNSIEVIENAISNDRRFRLIKQENQGVAQARNNGIRLAQAQFICCLDSDDFIAPQFFEMCVNALLKNPLAGIAYTRLQVIDYGLSSWLEGNFNYEAQTQRQNQIPTCNVFRKIAWSRVGGYRTNKQPCEDADTWLRIVSYGYTAIKASDQPLFNYRMHEKSLTTAIRNGFASEPNWTAGKGWIASNQFPALAGGKVRPVRNYDHPEVSIIIPVGVGHEQIIHDALDSVEGQSNPFWEVLVISDTHNPIDLEAYPYVRKFCTKASGSGASTARNIGIQNAKGKFCIFLDADDYLHPDFISKTLREYRQTGQYIYTDWTMHTLQGEIETHHAPEFHPDLIFQKGFYHGITCLVPTKWLREVGGFDESMRAFEDWDLYIKLQILGYCGKRIATPLFGYRYTTGTLREHGLETQSELKALMYKRYKEYMDGEKTPMACNCSNLRPPILEGVPEQDLIRIVYRSSLGAKHPVTGSQNYGSRKDGDTFFILAKDLELHTRYGHFELIPEVIDNQEVTEMPAELEYSA